MVKLYHQKKNNAIFPKVCSIYGLKVQFTDEQILTEGAEGFTCYLIFYNFSNNDAKLMTHREINCLLIKKG